MSIFDRNLKATENRKKWCAFYNNIEDIENNHGGENNSYINCRAGSPTKLLKTTTYKKNIAKEPSKPQNIIF